MTDLSEACMHAGRLAVHGRSGGEQKSETLPQAQKT